MVCSVVLESIHVKVLEIVELEMLLFYVIVMEV